MSLPIGLVRAHVVKSFRDALLAKARGEVVLAAALEHACYCLAAAQPTAASYERLALRALQLLEGPTGTKLSELGPLRFVGLPLETLVGYIPARAEILRHEVELRRSATLLRELRSGEMEDLGNYGLRCKFCNSNEIAYEFLQTRSADEGTTVFCTCKCGRRWKM